MDADATRGNTRRVVWCAVAAFVAALIYFFGSDFLPKRVAIYAIMASCLVAAFMVGRLIRDTRGAR